LAPNPKKGKKGGRQRQAPSILNAFTERAGEEGGKGKGGGLSALPYINRCRRGGKRGKKKERLFYLRCEQKKKKK